jgi:hypothetical protein
MQRRWSISSLFDPGAMHADITTIHDSGEAASKIAAPHAPPPYHALPLVYALHVATADLASTFQSNHPNVITRKQSFASAINPPEPVAVDVFHLSNYCMTGEAQFILHAVAREIRPQGLDP